MKVNQVVGYALSLAGLGVAVYVAGRAWKASRSSTIGDKVVDAVEGAVSTGSVTTGETGGADSADVTAQENSNFSGSYANMASMNSNFGGFSDMSPMNS
jgi:hypothetical protein